MPQLKKESPQRNAVPFCVKLNDERGGRLAADSLLAYHTDRLHTEMSKLRDMTIYLLKGDHAQARERGFRNCWIKKTRTAQP